MAKKKAGRPLAWTSRESRDKCRDKAHALRMLICVEGPGQLRLAQAARRFKVEPKDIVRAICENTEIPDRAKIQVLAQYCPLDLVCNCKRCGKLLRTRRATSAQVGVKASEQEPWAPIERVYCWEVDLDFIPLEPGQHHIIPLCKECATRFERKNHGEEE